MVQHQDLVSIRFGDYQNRGLYLHFADKGKLVLTQEVIEQTARTFWEDPSKIPPDVKEAALFQRCDICPLKGSGGLCDAIRPVFPLLDLVDSLVSFDEVVAIYVADDNEMLHVSRTTMQTALSWVSILSLTSYCQIGRKYWRYYFGIIPLLGAQEMAARIYLNMYWQHKGSQDEIAQVATSFEDEITTTARNQVTRLNMICKNDSFMNAFANAQIVPALLSCNIDDAIENALKLHENNRPKYQPLFLHR